ncbi:MAG TPA: sigma-70 family RNA polymerase sigma factor [Verrucomicrobiales bacterium]|jgi:RNA polymerase sigma-70 factor (ECF subfamily)|nr:sigma-70 family RNA polymerase sigma factor [Verrucomicrobiales bacterium]HIL71942.1 sigma-70 family RNA polymerase sigma factor [Verrucomicrobiota bacterium]
MDNSEDTERIASVLNGDISSFEPLIAKYQPRVFATVRRYARREDEIEDIVQEIFIKAFRKLATFRGEAPFEHWLMRLAVRTCYDFLRRHQRNRETNLSQLTDAQNEWLERFHVSDTADSGDAVAARELVELLLDKLSPSSKMVITLMEIEGKSVKEIAEIMGWTLSLVKVRAFRSRAQMRKHLAQLLKECPVTVEPIKTS